MELFDIDIEGDYPLIEVGRMKYDERLSGADMLVTTLSPDRGILLSVMDLDGEKIDIFYSDSGGANFSFVTNVSVPKPANADHQLVSPSRRQTSIYVKSYLGSRYMIINRQWGRLSYSLNFPLMGLNLLRLHLMAWCLFGMFEVKFHLWS